MLCVGLTPRLREGAQKKKIVEQGKVQSRTKYRIRGLGWTSCGRLGLFTLKTLFEWIFTEGLQSWEWLEGNGEGLIIPCLFQYRV